MAFLLFHERFGYISYFDYLMHLDFLKVAVYDIIDLC